MHTYPQLKHRDGVARTVLVATLVIGLTGCATRPLPGTAHESTETPYIGVFTGKFVDGRPIYRFPTIVVLGSRRSLTQDD